MTDTPRLPEFFGGGTDFMANATKFMQDLTPMGRLAKPEEIAAAGLFLAPDDASYITGAALLVDDGAIAK